MTSTNVGRFAWYELLTSDPKAAIAFYTEVVGWKTQQFENDYTMWVGDQGPLGGTMELPEQARAMGAPPHWLAYVEVADVDASAAKVKGLGGTVHVEPHDIPKIGRTAVITDPKGVVIALFRPLEPMKPHDSTKNGEFVWNELLTTDTPSGALAFYTELFGWTKLAEHDMGPMGIYLLYGIGDRQMGGMFTRPKEQQAPPPMFFYYVDVADLDAAIARAKAKGGKVLNGPMPVPGGARIAQLADPQGAVFALHEAPKAK